MSNLLEVLVPDIGNFDSVDVIEVLVREGDFVEKDQVLFTIDPRPFEVVLEEAKVNLAKAEAMADRICVMTPLH